MMMKSASDSPAESLSKELCRAVDNRLSAQSSQCPAHDREFECFCQTCKQ